MSLAWGSLVLLVVLLPGVLFFVGQYFPEKFTRETVERSALGQLGGTLLISLAIHGLLYCVLSSFCGTTVPCIDFGRFLTVLLLDKSDRTAIPSIAANVRAFRWWILSYVLLAAGLGALAGWAAGRAVIRGWLRFLAQHHWVYKLAPGTTFTVAYVMTRVQHEGRVLMYRGFLESFHLQKDGRFSYLVLTGARRFYMTLEKDYPVTSDRPNWKTIGDSSRAMEESGNADVEANRVYDETLFVIEGEDISNVVFDKYAVELPGRVNESTFNAAVEAAQRRVAQSVAQAVLNSVPFGPVAAEPVRDLIERAISDFGKRRWDGAAKPRVPPTPPARDASLAPESGDPPPTGPASGSE